MLSSAEVQNLKTFFRETFEEEYSQNPQQQVNTLSYDILIELIEEFNNEK